MTAPHPFTPTLDDIIFEGRNKAYGAFVLRKLYHHHLQRAAVLATALFALLVSTPLLLEYFSPTAIEIPGPVTVLPPVIDLQKFRIEPPQVQPQQRRAVAPPVVRPPEDIVPTVVKTLTKEPPVIAPPTPRPFTDEGPIDEGTGNATGTATGTGTASDSGTASVPAPTPAKPFLTAEVMPRFMDGDKALGEYFRKNLRYPPQALRNQISGKVFVSFTVGVTGEVQDVTVLKGLGYGTDEEAARVIRTMPAWKAGQQGGHAVPVRFTLPITFQFQ